MFFKKLPAVALFVLLAGLAMGLTTEEPLRSFTSMEGKSQDDRVVKYDSETQVVTLERAGKVPLQQLSEADRDYILKWNQVQGFKSTLRFKIKMESKKWADMRHEQNITPYIIDAVQLPGKTTPTHNILMMEDYEEYSSLSLRAEGFEFSVRNFNFFPIEDVTVESRIFYEQERYVISDDLYNGDDDEYPDTRMEQKVRYRTEQIPAIATREEIILYSGCAILVEHQVDRNALISTQADGEDGGGDTTSFGGGDISDHSRKRSGRVTGIWLRVGIQGPDGEMVWREYTKPSSLPEKFNWDGTRIEEEED